MTDYIGCTPAQVEWEGFPGIQSLVVTLESSKFRAIEALHCSFGPFGEGGFWLGRQPSRAQNRVVRYFQTLWRKLGFGDQGELPLDTLMRFAPEVKKAAASSEKSEAIKRFDQVCGEMAEMLTAPGKEATEEVGDKEII